MFGSIQKSYLENFAFVILRNIALFTREVCVFLKNQANFQHFWNYKIFCRLEQDFSLYKKNVDDIKGTDITLKQTNIFKPNFLLILVFLFQLINYEFLFHKKPSVLNFLVSEKLNLFLKQKFFHQKDQLIQLIQITFHQIISVEKHYFLPVV